MRKGPARESAYLSCETSDSQHTLAGSFLQKSHALLEQTLPLSKGLCRVLEVGAGTGPHYEHVRNCDEYVMTDRNEDMLHLASCKYPGALASGTLVLEKQDATSLTYLDNSFDRLIAAHVLEHLINPVHVLSEWNRVVRPGGLLSILLPCDPGMLWRLGRHMGPRRHARRSGIAYDYLMATEHINSIFNLVTLIRYHFDDIREHWYPLGIPIPDLNLFYMCHIQK